MARDVHDGSTMNATWRVFGPVRSTRLGVSLGVDPLRFKSCSQDCVYCQLGRTARPRMERWAPVAPAALLAELEENLDAIGPQGLDSISIVGAGEPTLYAGLGVLLEGIRSITNVPIAVLTNGTLLHRPEVRRELRAAATVMPSLDAGDEPTFQAVNRPHPDLCLERILEGLRDFREGFEGRLWMETMLVRGLNDSPSSLQALSKALAKIAPDEVHVRVPKRPPAEVWVRPPLPEALRAACALLGASEPHGHLDAPDCALPRWVRPDLLESILSIVGRHPMTSTELANTLNVPDEGAVEAWLGALWRERVVQRVCRFERVYWTTAQARHEGRVVRGRPRRRRHR